MKRQQKAENEFNNMNTKKAAALGSRPVDDLTNRKVLRKGFSGNLAKTLRKV